jgi:serine/threonine-protein kinase RsbW
MQTNGDRGVQAVSLTIPAEARWLALCRLVLSGLCQLGPVDDDVVGDLKLAVTEACSNSVRHAYEGNGNAIGRISLRYELGGDEVAVEVADLGRGFDFGQPLPELGPQPDEDLREDEMGLAIIHALVDDVEIGAGPEGRGTRIRFAKRLDQAGV